MLHLVGETIDKRRAHDRARSGELLQIIRGVYLDADDDIEATILRHAVRLALYLYPAACLASASAVYDAVTTRVFPGLANDRMALTINGKATG